MILIILNVDFRAPS